MSDFVGQAWLKRGCPFSFKFLLFMAEAGLLGNIRIVEMIEGEDSFRDIKDELSSKLGKPATFPTVEVAPGNFMSDSDELIAYFAGEYGIELEGLEALPFYLRGLMPRFQKLLKETRGYREKYGELV